MGVVYTLGFKPIIYPQWLEYIHFSIWIWT